MDSQNASYGAIQSVDMIEEKEPHKSHVRMIFITTLICLVAVGGYLALSREDIKLQLQQKLNMIQLIPEKNTETQNVALFASNIRDRTLPWVEAKADKTEVAVGGTLEVFIHGFSKGTDISGYDLLVGVDQTAFEIISVSSASPDFQLFHFDRGVYQSLTGVKDLNKKDATVFEDTPLVKMVLKAKTEGEQVVTLFATKGQEKTQFVDSAVQAQMPQIGSLSIHIK